MTYQKALKLLGGLSTLTALSACVPPPGYGYHSGPAPVVYRPAPQTVVVERPPVVVVVRPPPPAYHRPPPPPGPYQRPPPPPPGY